MKINSHAILQKGNQVWMIEDSLGSDHPRRVIISSSLFGAGAGGLRARWYPQSIGEGDGRGHDWLTAVHIQALFDKERGQWFLTRSDARLLLERQRDHRDYPKDVVAHEYAHKDISEHLTCDAAFQGAALLLPKDFGKILPMGDGGYQADPFEGCGILFLAMPWYSTLGVSPGLVGWLAGRILHSGDMLPRSFLVVSATGHVSGESDQWFDGPLGVLEISSPEQGGWLAYVPSGGSTALELDLPFGECPHRWPLQAEGEAASDRFWECVHRVYYARFFDAWQHMAQYGFAATLPKVRPFREREEGEEATPVNLSLECHLWVALTFEGKNNSDFLWDAISLLLLCQVFPETVPMVITTNFEKSGVEGVFLSGWKRFFENIGAHVVSSQDLSRVFASNPEIQVPRAVIDLSRLRGFWSPCPGFPWGDAEFVERWVSYLNQRVEILPRDLCGHYKKT